MPSTRQLAAIMFADIVGYTAMMQEDELLALQLLSKLRNKLEQVVVNHHGKIIEFRGDGALCKFKSTLEAVRAALAVQIDMQTDPVVPLRIGIHTGDVMVEGGNIYGDGVNIASRMESFAISGSIFISGRVQDDIKNQKEISTISLGNYLLKNVKEQVEIFAINHPGIKVPGNSALDGKGQKVQQKCILVLPFINLSNDPEQDYFSDGLTEELISNLLRLKEVKVISRTTSMKYKGTNKDIKTIGQEVAAKYIMEGSVRKHGNNLRITAQFIDASLDVHLWANTYNGTLDDIFEIQEKVASKIVEALRIQLTEGEKDVLLKRYTDNPDAYQLYLQGRFFWNKRNVPSLQNAILYFENAIQLDPDFALAWAGLADTYNLLGEYTMYSRRDLYPKAMAAVNKAMEIDSRLAEAHISLGALIMLNEWDWVNSGKQYRIGIELNPNYATGHHWYAEWLLYMGKADEAMKEMAIAVELDPISQAILKDQGICYYYTRQYDKAIESALLSLEMDPHFISAHRLLSMSYQGKGMFDKAISENLKWGQHSGNEVKTKVALAQIYAAAGQKEGARKLISEIQTNYTLTGNDYRGMALIYAALGENDLAFEWLEQSVERREESLCSIKVDPKWDPIRSDPRFDVMIVKMGMNI